MSDIEIPRSLEAAIEAIYSALNNTAARSERSYAEFCLEASRALRDAHQDYLDAVIEFYGGLPAGESIESYRERTSEEPLVRLHRKDGLSPEAIRHSKLAYLIMLAIEFSDGHYRSFDDKTHRQELSMDNLRREFLPAEEGKNGIMVHDPRNMRAYAQQLGLRGRFDQIWQAYDDFKSYQRGLGKR